jgi:Protein of unknown function (DUF1573)
MKKFLALALLLAGPAALAAPKITSPAPVFEYGEQPNTSKVEHNFEIRNAGDEPLVIDRVQASCGCTVAEVKDKTLAPGASTTVKATLDLHGRRGPQVKVITVYNNDPAAKEFRLTLSGSATVDVDVNPAYLFLQGVPFGQSATGTVTVTASGTNTVNVTGVEVSSPVAAVTFKNRGDGKRTDVTVVVTVPAGSPPNAYARVSLKTDNPRYAVVPFDVSMNVLESLTVVPNAMAFSIMTGPNATPVRPITRYVMIRPGTIADFKVTGATWPEDGVKATITRLDGSGPGAVPGKTPAPFQGYRIQFDNITPKLELNGKQVVITTDAPGKETIRLPVSIATFGAPLNSQTRVAAPLPTGAAPVPVPAPAGLPPALPASPATPPVAPPAPAVEAPAAK